MIDALASRASLDADFATACSTDVELFLHPLLEDPPARSRARRDTWSEYERLVAAARAACSRCPILVDCLYKAVVQTDVAGYVGCTTAKERATMRAMLGVTVEPEDLDAIAGARGARQPVDHEAVMAMRAAHPDDSLEQIANRLGCSLSTVKRHMRRARQAEQVREAGRPTESAGAGQPPEAAGAGKSVGAAGAGQPAEAAVARQSAVHGTDPAAHPGTTDPATGSAPRGVDDLPTVEEVFDAFEQVVESPQR